MTPEYATISLNKPQEVLREKMDKLDYINIKNPGSSRNAVLSSKIQGQGKEEREPQFV